MRGHTHGIIELHNLHPTITLIEAEGATSGASVNINSHLYSPSSLELGMVVVYRQEDMGQGLHNQELGVGNH